MDRLLAALSLCGLLLFATLLISDDFHRLVFGGSNQGLNGRIVGKISEATNDIRRRSASTHAWDKARMDESIRLGDSVFTGEDSRSEIELAEGGKVFLDSNSLVRFTQMDTIELPVLSRGNFRVEVNGTLKVAIGGKITEIEGKNSEVQIDVDQNQKFKIRLVKGTAGVKMEDRSTELVSDKALSSSDLESYKIQADTASSAPVLSPISDPFIYTETFNDVYELKNQHYVYREKRSERVSLEAPLNWTNADQALPIFAQLSSDQNFMNVSETARFNAADSSGNLSKVFVGENFVRISSDQMMWSAATTFEVISQPSLETPPQLKLETQNLFIIDDFAEIRGRIESNHTKFVLEFSDSPQFLEPRIRVKRWTGKDFSIRVRDPQIVYVRARGLNELQQLTEASSATLIQIQRSEKPVIAEQIIIKEEVRPAPLPPRRNVASSSDTEKKIIQTQPRAKRKPASVTTTTAQISTPKPDQLNLSYEKSKITFEGTRADLQSQDQMDQRQKQPSLLIASVRWNHWKQSHGIDFQFKTKVSDLSSSAATKTSPTTLEGKYYYRWQLPFNPFSNLRQSHFAVVGGYESYRNPGAHLFSPGYQLVKLGVNASFPVMKRWDAGAELFYGQGFESSSKYEFSGYLGYYFQQDWSLGFGYRMQLFQAGSDAATPLGLPYREGSAEGFSSLRWHY